MNQHPDYPAEAPKPRLGQGMGQLGRRAQAHKIAARPADYKVCCCCDSILHRRAGLCGWCHAYRFDSDKAAVISRARALGSRQSSIPEFS